MVMTTYNQMEDLFGSYFLSKRDTDIAFRNINKNALLKVVKGYKDYLNDKVTFPEDTYYEGIGIESNDEQILFSINNLYRLWEKSPYWLQKKGGGRFVAIAWKQPVNTIGLLGDAIIADYIPDGVRLKKRTPLYRLFTFACVS